jgi:death on curing protein
METTYLSAEEILIIHYGMMERYGEGEEAGIKFQDRFDYAVKRPQMVIFEVEVFPSIYEKAAALFHSIARGGHVFHNGNKRTALACLHTFCRFNGYQFMLSPEEAEKFTCEVAELEKYRGDAAIKEIAKILETCCISKGES